jgi:serine protease Do
MMASVLRTAVAAGALGVGIGVGAAVVDEHRTPEPAHAQQPLSEEASVILVARQATPAVVSVNRRGGSGSGVIIRPDGVILTNAHVVGNARTVQVGLANGDLLEGTVLGMDPSIDIAVVRVPGQNLPSAPIGNSDEVVVGQTAIAIGNPLALDRTVTRGIVSALDRSPIANLDQLIQTDAAINPGNSGGPLLDSRGSVIGINTAVLRGGGGIAEGLGFAVPINLAADVAQQLLTTGVIRRAYLGISYREVTAEMVRQFGLPVRGGVILQFVEQGSPAAAAGLRRGDIVTGIGEVEVTTSGDVRRTLREAQPGSTVIIRGVRPDGPFTVRARLGEVRS